MISCNSFKVWFDSPYYAILYKERNEDEAAFFLNNLLDFLHPAPCATMLDLACGKGRHALYLNQRGFDVTGIDFSEKNIEHNLKYENNNLSFFVHDMRNLFRINYFDFVYNLFTRFGYFDKEADNENVIKAVSKALKQNGKFIFDFMNVEKTIPELEEHETKIVDGIVFQIRRFVENNFIKKEISFTIHGANYFFMEQVRAYQLADIEKYFNNNDLEIAHLFGDYNLSSFNKHSSKRMILIAEKN